MKVPFTIGADPEIFFTDKEGVPKSAEGLIPGKKHNAHKETDRIEVMIDNVSAEFATKPVDNSLDFLETITEGITVLRTYAEKNGLDLLPKSVATFTKEELSTPNAMEFGCDPDFNAFTGTINRAPRATADFRTCGGHVHVGFDTNDINRRELVILLDIMVGLPLLYAEQSWDRAALYGKVGTYRPKDYGVEYRTPSNYWIFDPKLVAFVYSQVSKALDIAIEKKYPAEFIARARAVREWQDSRASSIAAGGKMSTFDLVPYMTKLHAAGLILKKDLTYLTKLAADVSAPSKAA